MDSKYRGKSIISVNVLSLACIILLIALHHQISYFLIYHVDGFEFGAHYFQSELMNLHIVLIRLSISVGNVIQRNVSSFRKRSPTSGACSTQREFPLPSENMNGVNLVNFPGILRLKVLQGYTTRTEGLFPCYQNYYLVWDRREKYNINP